MVADEDSGDAGAPPILLLHGWPDDPSSRIDVAARLEDRIRMRPLPAYAAAEDGVNPSAAAESASENSAGRSPIPRGVGRVPQREAPAAVALALVKLFTGD